ncbi:MAG: DNA polymerase IV [Pseudonocardiales bacterium]|nr:DNA polymerase IV [Pseudonocardiales bacterium]
MLARLSAAQPRTGVRRARPRTSQRHQLSTDPAPHHRALPWLNDGVPRWVVHLDMDAFFAAVEQLTRPTLAGRPVLVGGVGARGVVAGASYEARAYGVRSAMPMSQARRQCPSAVVLPLRLSVYRAVSERVFSVVREVAGPVEQVALDEAFTEPAELWGADQAAVEEFGMRLRERVRRYTGLAGSLGAGSGKQIAKIASGLAKPDGLCIVAQGREREVLAPLPVRRLWGVGPVAEAALRRVGVDTIGALAALSVYEVTSLLGATAGVALHRLAHGVDDRTVAERGHAKQVSAETTFEADLGDLASVRAAVTEMTIHAHRRLLTSARSARTVTVKVRGADFTTRSRSETAVTATTDVVALVDTAQRLVTSALPGSGVRLIGVLLSGLTSAAQQSLFDEPTRATPLTPTTATPAEWAEWHHAAPTPEPERPWRAGDDVTHPDYGHGWVQGAGHDRVTVRFETRSTGPGPVRTLTATDPNLTRADPLTSLD